MFGLASAVHEDDPERAVLAALAIKEAVQPRIAEIGRRLRVRGEDTETLAFECSGAVRKLRKQLGLPAGLSEIGITEDDLPKLAQLAMEDGCHEQNPRACGVEDMLALYRASLE